MGFLFDIWRLDAEKAQVSAHALGKVLCEHAGLLSGLSVHS